MSLSISFKKKLHFRSTPTELLPELFLCLSVGATQFLRMKLFLRNSFYPQIFLLPNPSTFHTPIWKTMRKLENYLKNVPVGIFRVFPCYLYVYFKKKKKKNTLGSRPLKSWKLHCWLFPALTRARFRHLACRWMDGIAPINKSVIDWLMTSYRNKTKIPRPQCQRLTINIDLTQIDITKS